MKYLFASLGTALLIVAGATIFFHFDRGAYDPDGTPYAEKLTYWKSRIHAVGGVKAYEELAVFVKSYTVGVQHNETHVFGSALYSEEGIQGVGVCDDRFEYACFHQVIGEVLSDLGMSSFPKVVEICKGSPACLHSVGHGVLALEGYTFADLQRAIQVCEALPGDVYVHGCYGGLFMEYNMRRLLSDSQHPRTIGENWLEPCDAFSGVLGRICYYWQPTWWRSQIAPEDLILTEPGFKRMGDLCESVPDVELRASCFEGTGVITLNSGGTTNDGVAACDSVSQSDFGNALCRTGAARLIVLLGHYDEARAVCLSLAGVYEKGCLKEIDTAQPDGAFSEMSLPSKR